MRRIIMTKQNGGEGIWGAVAGRIKKQGRFLLADRAKIAGLPVFLLAAVFAVVSFRRAWLGDDAFITFRVVDNFIHGYGLTWNPAERVQVFTHPLWMFVLSFGYFFSRDLLYMPMLLGVGLSTAAVFFVGTRAADTRTAGLIAVLLLLFSRAFVDYSTSGLENSLSYLLVVVFFLQLFLVPPSECWLGWLSFTASLGITNRMDTALIFLPALVYGLVRVRTWKGVMFAAAGQAPFVLWEMFSLWYYGFLFPNTAYAKLNTGISNAEYFRQGLLYLKYTIQNDPVTMLGIAAGIGAGSLAKDRRTLLAVMGCLLYILYIIRIGGDFMGGRFLTAPLLCAAIALARYDFSAWPRFATVLLCGVVVGTGVLVPEESTFDLGNLQVKSIEEMKVVNGITDERAWYVTGTSILNNFPEKTLHYYPQVQRGLGYREAQEKVVVNYAIGFTGFFSGPEVFMIDALALADPLLARLPSIYRVNWRIGHFDRVIPDGYKESAAEGENRIQDPALAEYYDRLKEITRGNLFSPQRMKTIIKMNLGSYSHLIDQERYRYPYTKFAPLSEVEQPIQEAPAPCRSDSPDRISDSGAVVSLPSTSQAARLEIELSPDDAYRVEFLSGRRLQAVIEIPASGQELRAALTADVPVAAQRSGFDRVRILPIFGAEPYCFRQLRFLNDGE